MDEAAPQASAGARQRGLRRWLRRPLTVPPQPGQPQAACNKASVLTDT